MKPTRVLLVRVDRLGDLVVTLPIEQLSIFDNKNVTWLIPKGLEFLFESRRKTNFFSIDKSKTKENFKNLVKWLKENHFDEVVIFHAPSWVYFAVWFSRIKNRMGVYSQWHSFVTLTKGVRQKRSEALFHELEYNRRLVLELYNAKDKTQRIKPLKLDNQNKPSKKYIVIHPGMMGSARNWSLESYKSLIKTLAHHVPIVVTGSKTDHAWTQPLKEDLHQLPNLDFQDQIASSQQWLSVLSQSSCVVAPSTGTIHIAASLGVPTIGIYSPVKVQAPRRWAPLGDHAHTLVPTPPCPGEHECLREKCPYFDCMNQITVEAVAKQVLDILT